MACDKMRKLEFTLQDEKHIKNVRYHVNVRMKLIGEELNKLTASVPILFYLYINAVCMKVTSC